MSKRRLRSVCVYCGSSVGRRAEYVDLARELGDLLGSRGIRLVYGGAQVGVMGALADAALEAGGEVIGIIPEGLRRKEIAHEGVTDLRVVASMHERKAMMVEEAEAFVALPGGIGTLEELFEVLTWAQLGLHRKPLGILDVGGFYAPLRVFLDHAVAEGFITADHRGMLMVDTDPVRLLDRFASYEAPEVRKWIDPETT